MDHAIAMLTDTPDLGVITEPASLADASHDFGHLCVGSVLAMLAPRTAEALRAVVAWAARSGIPLTPRGRGLSQSGQAIPIGGCVIDLSAFDTVKVEEGIQLVHCGAAATWGSVLEATARHGLAPAIAPLNLDLSVGGFLSAGGHGSTSHRFGLAVSNVESCEVVTGAGELVTCSPTQRPDVFHAVLGGAGRFGFLLEATMRLRPMPERARTMTLLYDDLRTCLEDHRRLAQEPWAHHLEGFCSAAIQGLRRGVQGGRRVPFARWFHGLHVTTEHESGREPPESVVHGLRHREVVLVDDDDSVAFARRYEARFDAMRMTGAWELAHPWLEVLLPFEAAVETIPQILHRLPLFLGDGHRVSLIGPGRRPELMAFPDGEPVVAFAMLPMGVPEALKAPALGALRAAHEALLAVGGKRYLSGWLFEPDEAAWRRHFGERYDTWQARKRELDPTGILTSVLFPGARLA